MASKEHLVLSEYIKTVHRELRLLSRVVGPAQAWEEHCKNKQTLEKYATSMKDLATNHWNKHSLTECPVSRIEWVHHHCQKYFVFGDQESEIRKEILLAEKHNVHFDKNFQDNFNNCKYNGNTLELLDVGSCYNPFKQYPLFNVTAVDLFPATDDVLQCDFLKAQLEICENDDLNRHVMSIGKYDIIVFSLFLEYLPSSEQRFHCCTKAYELLKPSGLLFILTPDSKHATANSKLMKTWRVCLSSLGFNRVYYEKLKHLHCISFKKTFVKELPFRWFTLKNRDDQLPETMLKIPQDSILTDEVCSSNSEVLSNVCEEIEDINIFQVLPFKEDYL